MKAGFRPLAALLAILGAEDLVMVPIMIGANHHHAGTPPAAAIVLSGVLGAATLASIPGLAQGRRWALWVAVISRIVDAVNSLLGVAFGPGVVFVVSGAFALVLSIAAVLLLIRLRPRRAVRAASSA
jgi:hypothetical protein